MDEAVKLSARYRCTYGGKDASYVYVFRADRTDMLIRLDDGAVVRKQGIHSVTFDGDAVVSVACEPT